MRFLKKIRRAEILLASISFVLVFFFFVKTYDKSILEIQLSYWGAFSKNAWLWNSLIVFISISILNNTMLYLDSIKSHRFYIILMFGVMVMCSNLFVTGAISMHYQNQVHTICALVYFFAFPTILLVLSMDKQTLNFRARSVHFFFALAMLFVPISIAKLFPGFGVAEAAHSFLAIGWNVWILPKR